MAEAIIRPALPEDAEALAPILREQDRNEIKASHGLDPLEALKLSLRLSEECYCAEVDGKVIMMYGVGNKGDGIGVPWMLGSDDLDGRSKELLKKSKPWVDGLFTKYALLYNYVHADNTKSVKWLRWLGFIFLRPVVFPSGATFYEFVRIRNV